MPATKKSILIVDDEVDFVRSMAYRLDFEGFNTIEATSGQQALKILETEKPDIILLDVMMPGMTGIEFFDVLRKKSEFQKIPVIFLTVWDKLLSLDPKDKITRHVIKPFNFHELLDTINRMLSQSGEEA